MQDEISSPTFTIVNEHNANNINIYHFDVYRLDTSDEFLAIGGDEYLSNGICIIEWGEIIKDMLPEDYLEINFTIDIQNEDSRTITLTSVGLKWEAKIENFKY